MTTRMAIRARLGEARAVRSEVGIMNASPGESWVGERAGWLEMGPTYVVPDGVSTFTAVGMRRQEDR
jgi:hypothetical protein